MAILFSYTDVDGDKLAVFDASIPGVEAAVIPGKGNGINIKTSPQGCSIPRNHILGLVEVLLKAAEHEA